MPAISAIIPTYNRADNVCRAVDSVLAQRWPDLELIVVDDGSTDNTAEVLKAYGSRIRYVHQENGGPARARNTGVKNAAGDWLAFLDSDDLWFPGKLERQMAFIQSTGADICFHDLELSTPGAPDYIPSWIRTPHVRDCLGRELRSGVLHDAFASLCRAGHAFLTTTFVVRRSAFTAAGGMREWLLTNQDIDLYLRLFPRSRVAFLVETLAAYNRGTSRAFEIASKKAASRAHRGKARVHLDRSRAMFAAMCDRLSADDKAGAAQCAASMSTSLKKLARCYRRSQLFWRSILTNATRLIVSNSSPDLAARQLLRWPGAAVLDWPENAPPMATFLNSPTLTQPSRSTQTHVIRKDAVQDSQKSG